MQAQVTKVQALARRHLARKAYIALSSEYFYKSSNLSQRDSIMPIALQFIETC